MITNVTRIVIIFLLLIMVGGCGKTTNSDKPQGAIQVKGSDTLVNAAQKVSEEFMKKYPDIFVSITGGGTGVGIASLINKFCDIALASREMMPKEIETAQKQGVSPKEFTVAYDGVTVIVNKSNPVEKLSIQDLHKIFTGKSTNWKEFGGKDIPIVTLSREVNSGTHMYFKEKVIQLGDRTSSQEFSPQTLLLSSSQAIVEEVTTNEAAVGYLGMGYISNRTKTLLLGENSQFYLPDTETVRSSQYPLSRSLYFYTNGEPKGSAKLFIDFALSPQGQQQFKETGFVPLGVISAEKTQ